MRFSARVLVLDVDAMLTWGLLVGRLERLGKPLPAIDSLIAALALQYNCNLVTRKADDFKETGVTVVNPWARFPRLFGLFRAFWPSVLFVKVS
jgi:tRNA(fMet)-specific endonuclease VapC